MAEYCRPEQMSCPASPAMSVPERASKPVASNALQQERLAGVGPEAEAQCSAELMPGWLAQVEAEEDAGADRDQPWCEVSNELAGRDFLVGALGRSKEDIQAMKDRAGPYEQQQWTGDLIDASHSQDPHREAMFEDYCARSKDEAMCGSGQMRGDGSNHRHLDFSGQKGRRYFEGQQTIRDIRGGPAGTLGAGLGLMRWGGAEGMARGARGMAAWDGLLAGAAHSFRPPTTAPGAQSPPVPHRPQWGAPELAPPVFKDTGTHLGPNQPNPYTPARGHRGHPGRKIK